MNEYPVVTKASTDPAVADYTSRHILEIKMEEDAKKEEDITQDQPPSTHIITLEVEIV